MTRVPVFVAAFRPRGLFTQLRRAVPGFIDVDLLRNPSDPSKFLSTEFWTSIEALLAARRSLEVRSFVRWLDRQAIDSEGLGMLLFPPQRSTEEAALDELTCVSASGTGEHPPATENEARP